MICLSLFFMQNKIYTCNMLILENQKGVRYMIYLDNAATTKPDKEVIDAMLPYLTESYGNPSASYWLGVEGKKAIKVARQIIARKINANEDEIYFTSGATESNNWIIDSLRYVNPKKKHIITSKIEHKSVLEAVKNLEKKGYTVTYLNVNNEGRISMDELKDSINENTGFISIMHTNNETGSIQDINRIGEIAKGNNIIFHTDATQGYGKEKIDVRESNISCMTVSGHKLFAPKGIGFLYCKKGIKIQNVFYGGGQEYGLRAGTENVAEIVALGKATEISDKFHIAKVDNCNMTQYMVKRIQNEIPNTYINGNTIQNLKSIANILIKGVSNTALVLQMDMQGICISNGSACSQGTSEPSYVLKAIGLNDEDANSSIRISLSYENTANEIDFFVDKLKETVNKLRKVKKLDFKIKNKGEKK